MLLSLLRWFPFWCYYFNTTAVVTRYARTLYYRISRFGLEYIEEGFASTKQSIWPFTERGYIGCQT